jgi:hypothetical protein
MSGSTLLVPHAEFSIEEPFAIPEACNAIGLRRATDGSESRLATRVALYRDRAFLHVVFSGQDDGVVATHFGHDEPLYQEDVVEVFLAPADLKVYFEIEVNPLATTFDARISSPDGVRSTMKTDLEWTCNGLFAAVRKTPASLDVLMRFPFESLDVAPPQRGSIWRANFFRIDRHKTLGDEFMAWCPTMKNPADFHVPAAFGQLQFE